MENDSEARVTLQIPFKIIPKARPRVVRSQNGKSCAFMPKEYKEQLRVLGLMVRTSTPKGWDKRKSYRVYLHARFENAVGGDVDNLAGTILDACNGVLWEDDRQVVELTVRKSIEARDSFVCIGYDEESGFEPKDKPAAKRPSGVKRPRRQKQQELPLEVKTK